MLRQFLIKPSRISANQLIISKLNHFEIQSKSPLILWLDSLPTVRKGEISRKLLGHMNEKTGPHGRRAGLKESSARDN